MLYEEIKAKRIEAMKDSKEAIKNILTVLLGEVDRVKDTKGTDDSIIISAVNKMVKSAKETIEMCEPKGLDISDALQVIEILDMFRPKTLPEIAIRAIVVMAFNKLGHETPIGKFMTEFKTHEGMDMKIASAILKELRG